MGIPSNILETEDAYAMTPQRFEHVNAFACLI
jgi:hypothetical protein